MIDWPEYRALNREVSLAAHVLCNGLNSIRKTNIGQPGIYNEAFFGLSIGIERLIKIGLIVDHCIDHSGNFPNNNTLRKLGHDLEVLVGRAIDLRAKYETSEGLAQYPNNEIVSAIVSCLSEFAKATRYYNLDFLASGGKSSKISIDPLAAWTNEVEERILKKHYTTKRKSSDAAISAEMGTILNEFAIAIHTAPDGSPVSDMVDLQVYLRAHLITQKWSQFYCLLLARFLSILLKDLHLQAIRNRLMFIPCFSDHLRIFINEDSMLKSRKTWQPI